jgi:hypothetical protein
MEVCFLPNMSPICQLLYKNYYGDNYFITILGFSIYKSYYLSEQKTKNVNVYKFFIYELNKTIDDIKNHSTNNSFLYAMKKKRNFQ